MSLQNIIGFVYLYLFALYACIEAIIKFFIPQNFKSLKGEIILVTGSASGIGKAICSELCDLGATLVCWDFNKEQNDEFVNNLKTVGVKAFGYHLDVTDREQVKKAAQKVRDEVGDVSIVINNAGAAFAGEFIHSDPDEMIKNFNINVFSHFYILKEFLPSMIAKKKGHIAATCSIVAIESMPFTLPYCSSKFAVDGYMESLRKEIALHPDKPDIKFTTIYPSAVNTRLITDRADISNAFPMLLTPQYVAKSYVNAIRQNKVRHVVPFWIKYVIYLFQLLPDKLSLELAKFGRSRIVLKKLEAKITY